MPMQLMCTKGCGHAINVDDEQIEESKSHGAPLDVSHEVCPTDPQAPQRKFRIVTEVFEIVPNDGAYALQSGEHHERLAGMGKTHEAGSFKLALPTLQESLNEQWSLIVGMADTIDDGTPPPTKSSTEEGN